MALATPKQPHPTVGADPRVCPNFNQKRRLRPNSSPNREIVTTNTTFTYLSQTTGYKPHLTVYTEISSTFQI